jgi:acyl carrier protein
MPAPVFERLTALLNSRFGVPSDELRPDATFDELDLDSLALVELVMVVQKEFGVPFGEDEISPQATVADAARLIGARSDV